MLWYRVLLTLAAPLLVLSGFVRLFRRRETWDDLSERVGRCSIADVSPVLWVHGASNGELTSARGLLFRLLEEHPCLHITVTTNTTSGRRLVNEWQHPRLHAALAPLDFRLCTRWFLRRINPLGLLTLEGEIWPNRLTLLSGSDLPVAMVAARLSQRSARRWARRVSLARIALAHVSLISPQSSNDGERLLAIGAPVRALAPVCTLKAAVSVSVPEEAEVAALSVALPRPLTWLAASTHPGEERIVLAAHRLASERRPGLKLILAPRHPVRGDELEAEIKAFGFRSARRSRGASATNNTEVYLADTLGEMGLWYRLCGVCFVGGSLVNRGGHTPYEPAQFGCALIHGPHLSNFAGPYRALSQAKAAQLVNTVEDLADAVSELGHERAERQGLAAQDVLQQEQSKSRVAEVDLRQRLAALMRLP